jgi:hypothetical protein
MIDEKKPLRWVDTNEHQQAWKPMSPNGFSGGKMSHDDPEQWYAKRFPIVVAAKEWDVGRSRASMLPTKKKIGKVRIEVRRKSDKPLGIHGYRDLEEGSQFSNWSELLMDGDVIVFNILKREYEGSISAAATATSPNLRNSGKTQESQGTRGVPQLRPSSSGSVSTIGFRGVDDSIQRLSSLMEAPGQWSVKVSTPISKISVSRDGSRCNTTLGNMNDNSIEEMILSFLSEDEAKSFVRFVREIKKAHKDVAKKVIQNTMEYGSLVSSVQSVDFLVEIISATDLKAVNRRTSDPYVVVYHGGKKIHKTGVVKKNLDPIWTVETQSMFIFTLFPEDYYNSELTFEVRDYETFVKGDNLGRAMLSNERLMEANGKRVEMRLKDDEAVTDVQGYLAVRCRKATSNDKKFIQDSNNSRARVKRNQLDLIEPLYSRQNPVFQFDKKKLIDGKKHYFVRPMDPSKETKWLTKEQIEEKSKEPSLNWTEAGTGSLGELFVEVISCHGLPNLDRGLPSNKTDAFATLIFEDAIVSTEVVRDCLSPRFMPWTRRAFKFNIEYVTSSLFIGVFDHDQGNKYDHVGRVAIPLEKFRPNTAYDLSYDLYDSAEISSRRKRGKINLRIRVNWKQQRKMFFNALRKKELFTVNMDSKPHYDYAKYTAEGCFDLKEYNFKTLMSYVDELSKYQFFVVPVINFLKTVFLWRGHYEVKICFCIKFKLPVHSLVMLSFGIVLVEFPQYSLSVFFASIGWFMLALLEYRRKRPFLWDRPPWYTNLLLRFLIGRSRPDRIDVNENMDQDLNYIDNQMAQMEENKRVTEKFWQRLSSDLEDLDAMKKDILFKDSMNKTRTLQIFKNQLFPIQLLLMDIVNRLRYVKSVLCWDQM